jgi:nucleotide-binding universal stress UspA family protein
MYKRILIPTDGSKLSDKAIKEGVKLAKTLGARVTGFIATPRFRVVTVDPLMMTDTPQQYQRHSKKLAAKALDVVKRAAQSAGVRCDTTHVTADHPYDAIIRAARRNRCDLILMASHGRKGVSGFLLGSETMKVLTHSKIPVLVCR